MQVSEGIVYLNEFPRRSKENTEMRQEKQKIKSCLSENRFKQLRSLVCIWIQISLEVNNNNNYYLLLWYM